MTTSSSRKMKASDRQAVIRRVTSLLQKRYGRSLPKSNRDVLQTLLFGITLENASQEAAEAALANLIAGFHDLNEIRVSSITELEGLLTGVPQADWKALRIREALQFTFEKYYNFDLEPLRRKTMDIAEKQLAKVAYLTPFVRNYVLQHSLGSHVVPVDDATRVVIQWLGLASPDANNDSAAEEVKSAVRKQDAPLFCHLLRALVTDRRYAGTFTPANSPLAEGDPDGALAVERLKQHMAHPPRVAKKSVKKSRKRPPVAHRTAKRSRTAGGTVRKKVSKPKVSGSRRR
jgi:endonuclease III